MNLRFQNKQAAGAQKKRLSCQVSLEELTMKHITVNEKVM